MVYPPMSCLIIHFYRAYPSCTGVAYVVFKPESKITAVDLPQEKEESTGDLHKNIAGT